MFGGGDTNLYGYTFNDPVNWIDPNGTSALGIIGAIVGGILAPIPTDTHMSPMDEGLRVIGGAAAGAAAGEMCSSVAASAGVSAWIRRYPNSGGGGIGVNAGGKNVIRIDIHPIEPGGPYLPHVDIPGIVKHWPWE